MQKKKSLKIPAPAEKKLTQKDKQERGQKGEADITASLRKAGLWNYKMPNAGFGSPFDKVVIPPGGGYAVEVKVSQSGTIAYSRIEENERAGLAKFDRMVGQGHAFIIGIWRQEGEKQRAFMIPWHRVSDQVCSGIKGSIKMLDFPELAKVTGGWDLSSLRKEKA